jgi:hypothetical protein
MKRRSRHLSILSILALFFILSCAPTKFARVWKDENYTGGPFRKIFVVGVFSELKHKKLFEDTFTEKMKGKGLEAVSSMSVILASSELSRERVRSEAKKLDMQAVLVTEMISLEEERLHYDPLHYHFHYLKEITNYPVSYTEVNSVRLVTNLYEVETEKLIWSGVTETFRPQTAGEVVDSLCLAVLTRLKDQNLIP